MAKKSKVEKAVTDLLGGAQNTAPYANLNINVVNENPNNPRKHYDEIELQELAESIKSYGVIQPITVREKEPGVYEVVAGNRRYKASVLAGIKTIPAVIKQLTDEQALEIALIENIQRVDVHPMEEASSFKQLIEKQNYTVENVAAKFGKSIYFVRQRLKLNDLSEASQKLFYAGLFNINIALKLSQFNEAIQAKVIGSAYNSWQKTYSFHESSFSAYQGDLSNATFELNNPDLDTNAGPCTACSYNSAVSTLFPEEASSPKCRKPECFANKTETQFSKSLEEAKEKGVLLANNYWSTSPITSKLKSEGIAVYENNNGWRVINKPEPPDYEDFKHEWLYDNSDDEDYERTMSEDWEERMKEYNDEIDEYNKECEEGTEVFIYDGTHKGTYQRIKIYSSSAASTVLTPEETVKESISKIKSREARAKELDAEKVWTRICELVKSEEALLIRDDALNEQELEIFRKAILEKLGWDSQKKGAKLNTHSLYRYFILKTLVGAYGSHLSGENNKAAYQYIKAILPDHIELFEAEQKEVAEKRKKRVNERIAELNKELKGVRAGL